MGNKNIQIVEKMIGYAKKILSYCDGVSKEFFLEDDRIAELCAFNFIQLGEQVGVLDDEFIVVHDTVPWHKIRGVRHRIVHDYLSVDLELIWEIISDDLPGLIQQLGGIVEALPESASKTV
jgi:uncharacterized protein with HEPN domain